LFALACAGNFVDKRTLPPFHGKFYALDCFCAIGQIFKMRFGIKLEHLANVLFEEAQDWNNAYNGLNSMVSTQK
jgi:hypothetical protein